MRPAPVIVDTVTPAPSSSCTTQLAECRTASWNIVARTIRADVEQQRPTVVEPTSATSQDKARCEIAEQQAREHWVRERANIYASVKDVGTPAFIDSEIEKTLGSLEKDLGVRDRARLEREYRSLWQKHGPIFRAALAKEDWSALIGVVQAYWRDEDALIERNVGSTQRDEYRALELRNRTAIVSILAALADKPFDETLVW